jgi:hypothetical protein
VDFKAKIKECILGKITLVKSLILPVLNHLFIALPNPSIEIIKDIEDMLYTFIWKSSGYHAKGVSRGGT